MHPMDQTLQASFPTVMVPRFGAVEPMAGVGERMLVAANGVFLEVVRPWFHVVRKIATYSVDTAIPYGNQQERTTLPCGPIPADLIADFGAMARAAMPNETGAWVVWNMTTGRFRLVPVTILAHGAGHLSYDRPELQLDEQLVMDCHSHGAAEAFFSRTDNQDDKHDVKFAFVLGNCGTDRPSMALRLCIKGIFERVAEVPVAWRAAVAEQGVL